MTLKQALAKRKRKSKRIARLQKRRKHAHSVAEWAKKHDYGKLRRTAAGIVKRLTNEIRKIHASLRKLDRWIDQHQHDHENNATKTVAWERAQVGTVEGSAKQREWASDLGYSWTLPWCSIFQGYALKHHGFAGKLPSNPAYSGAWLTWGNGDRVTYASAKVGDLLIFDWGDGGITDHVAMYAGGGMKIGGNESDRVEYDAVPTTNIVGVVRPKW